MTDQHALLPRTRRSNALHPIDDLNRITTWICRQQAAAGLRSITAMANSLEREQELSEDLLWDDGGDVSASDDAASSEEPEQPPAPRTEDSSRKHKGVDIAGAWW